MATKHILGGAAALGAGAYAMNNGLPEVVGNIASTGAGAVSGVAETINDAVSGLLQAGGVNSSIAGAALPSIATAFAANYVAGKVTDWANIDGRVKRYIKLAASAAGFTAGAIGDSVAMPYFLAAAGLIAVKDIPLYALGKVGQGVGGLVGAPVGFVWGGVKGAGKGAWNTTKQFASGSFGKPEVGF